MARNSTISKFKIGIVGPRGIGLSYLREAINLGFNQIYIYSRNFKKNKKIIKNFPNSLQKKIILCKDINFFSSKIDIVCICSSTQTHLNYINFFINKNIRVLCEKPLFWINKASKKKIISQLERIFANSKRKLITNLPLSFYTKSILKLIKKKEIIKNIEFKYLTKGKNTYNNIAIDLLPHALSCILTIFKNRINSFKIVFVKKKKDKWESLILINKVKIYIYFEQNKFFKSTNLNIKINNTIFEREQIFYKSYLKSPATYLKYCGKNKRIKNPMSESIKFNLSILLNSHVKKKDIDFNQNIMRLAYKCIK